MTTQNQPPDRRTQTLADLRELVDFLTEHPEVPLGQRDPLEYVVLEGDDEQGIARVTAIARALGVPVTDNAGRDATDETTHLNARKAFGAVAYEATYIRRDWMAQYADDQKYLAERRKAVES